MNVIRRVFSLEAFLVACVLIVASLGIFTVVRAGATKDAKHIVRDVLVYEREGHRFLVFDVRSPFADQYGVSVAHDPDCPCQK